MKIVNNRTNAVWNDVSFPLFAKREGVYGYYVVTHDFKMLFFYEDSGEVVINDLTSEFTIIV